MFHVEHFKKIFLFGLILILLLFLIKPNLHALFLQSLEERSFYLNVSRGTILANPIFGIGAGQFVLSIPKYTQKTLEIWQFQPVHNIYLEMWSEIGIIGLGLFLWMIWKLFHVEQLRRSTPHENCSTRAPQKRNDFAGWNNPSRLNINNQANSIDKIVPRGTIKSERGIANQEFNLKDNYILCNSCSLLSIRTTLVYFQAILLGLLFIGLFDHYLWDIWPGQVLLWLVMGVIAGIKMNTSLDKN